MVSVNGLCRMQVLAVRSIHVACACVKRGHLQGI